MATRWISAAQLAELVGPPAAAAGLQPRSPTGSGCSSSTAGWSTGSGCPSERELAAQLGSVGRRSPPRTPCCASRAAARPGRARATTSDRPRGPASRLVPGTVREVEGAITMTFSAAAAAPGLVAAYARAVELLPELLAGHGYFPDGLPVLRERLADWYTARGLPTDPTS